MHPRDALRAVTAVAVGAVTAGCTTPSAGPAPDAPAVRMTPAQARAEIDGCARTLRAVTGSIGRWFRPSRTRHATATVRAAALRAGYPACLSYDVDSLDYTDPGAAAVVRATLAAVRPGSIVSLHVGHESTVGAMPALLSGLRRRGLTPVTVTDLLT